MSELRWILLVAGVLLIAGIYLWGVRARRRSAAPEHERVARVEPARTVAVVAEPPRVEPEVRLDDTPPDQPSPIVAEDYEEPAVLRTQGAGRREPRLEPRFEDGLETATGSPRHEPRLVPESAPPPGAAPELEPTQRIERPEPRKAPAQKIVAVRVVAAPGTQFGGVQLAAALAADGFTFGRYQIFHRLDASGRPIVSLASLKEPGTFEPERMAGADFRGVALFTVIPGPQPGLQAFDELIITARALAAHLSGHLQDERGGPLTVGRIGQLRDEIAAYERARGATGD
jgi:cell division protein ZipA